jgi:hypothetical protein
VRYGDANVLSTSMRILGLIFLTAVETAYISINFIVGLVGVSIQTSLVSSLILFNILSTFVISTKSIFNPCLYSPNLFMYRKVPP